MLKKTTGGSLNVIKGFVVYGYVWARLSMFSVRVIRVLSKHPHGVQCARAVKYVVGVKDVRTDDLVDLLFKKKRKGDTVKK